MGSNNYGEVVQGVNILAWVAKCDWSRRYHILSIDSKTSIPDLMNVEVALTVPGDEVRERISRCRPEDMEAVNWGNGHFGLCLYDGQKLHYILVHTDY